MCLAIHAALWPDTPRDRWCKQVASHLGGTRSGMVVTWPKRIKDAGGMRIQLHHVIDIGPTILDAIGIRSRTWWKMDPQGLAVARGGTGTLSVNGRQVAQRLLPRTIPFIWAWDETFDIGLDTGTPVDDSDYQVSFAFTGKLAKITFDLAKQV